MKKLIQLILVVTVILASFSAYADQSLREKIRNIDKESFLYASQPVEPFYFGSNRTAVLTDGYWFGWLNNDLFSICEGSGGAIQSTVIDTFTGQKIKKTGIKNNKLYVWECVGGSNEFAVNSIVTNEYSQSSVGKAPDNKIFIMIDSNNSGAPVLSERQKKVLEEHPDADLKAYLDSFHKFAFGRALSKAVLQNDGSLMQMYHHRTDDKTDIQKDTGILFEMNVFCANNGGSMNPVSGYSEDDIKQSILPGNAVFQCDSTTKPFYVKFVSQAQKRYVAYIREGVLENYNPQALATVNQEPVVNNSIQDVVSQSLANSLDAAQVAEMQMLNVVSSSMPKAMLSDQEHNISVYWIKQNNTCDNVATVKTLKNSGELTEINNFLRCNGQLKPLGKTHLPVRIPSSLQNQQSSFIGQIKASGSLYYFDTNTGMTVIGRKTDNSCGVTLYYLQGESLIAVVNDGC